MSTFKQTSVFLRQPSIPLSVLSISNLTNKMKEVRYSFLFLPLFLFATEVHAQEAEGAKTHPFEKGRFITGINGSIRSGQKSRTTINSSQDSKTFDFTLGTQSGVFIRKRLLLGGSLQVSKSNSETSVLKLNEEIFTIGPWTRYYLGKDPKASIFIELNLFFARENIDTQSGTITNRELKANGFGGSAGTGFTYVVNNNIAFDLTLAYNAIQFYGKDYNLLTDTSSKINFSESFLAVTFGFRIMLNEFFF